QVQRGERLRRELLAAQQPGPDAAEVGAQALEAPLAGLREDNLALAQVEQEILVLDQLLAQLDALQRDTLLVAGARRRGDDQRRARLVHQHAVGLVDDREAQAAQKQLVHRRVAAGKLLELKPQRAVARAERNAVAQVVEYDGLVGAVGNVAGIGRLALGRLLLLGDHSDAQAK